MDWGSIGFVAFIAGIFLVPLIGIPWLLNLIFGKKKQKPKMQRSQNRQTISHTVKPSAPPVDNRPTQFKPWYELIPPDDDSSFDWNSARAALQKISYGMVGNQVTQADKDLFKEFMTYFASRDPLYKKTIVRIKTALQQNGTLLQSDLYKGESDFDKEMARYILYFAEALGDIQREKKGRSYLLSLPE